MKSLTQRLKRFSGDERGVSPVIGFVLMFALIMIVFTIYQASVVPAQNEQVEYEHSQTIEGQMGQLQSEIISTSSSGDPRGVSLQLGVQYPSRAFAINPGNPVGTLETVDTPGVTISGLNAEHGDGSQTFKNSFIDYKPNYLRMSEETETSLEYGMRIKDYSQSDNTRLESAGPLFPSSKKRVNLILFGGEFGKHEMSTTVTTEAVDNRTVTVTSGSADLALPTTLSEDQWETVLDGKPQVSNWKYRKGASEVDITLVNGTSVRLSKVAVGDPNTDVDPIKTKQYLENVTPLSADVSYGKESTLAVRVEDQFGNPLPGSAVEASVVDGEGDLDKTTKTSNETGEAAFKYNPVPSDAGTTMKVAVSLVNGSESRPITFERTYPEAHVEKVTSDPIDGTANVSEALTVRVTDQNGNPLPGVEVGASSDGDGGISQDTLSTDENGEATFVYEPSDGDAGNTVEVPINISNGASGEDSSVTFELNYPSVNNAPNGTNREPIKANKLRKGKVNQLVFKITPSPIDISGFSVITKGEAKNLNETSYPNQFQLNNSKYIEGVSSGYGPLLYQATGEPIQFDGQDYIFKHGPRRVTSSGVYLQQWPMSDNVHINGIVNSYKEADIIIYFILQDGTKRPVYIDATVGSTSGTR